MQTGRSRPPRPALCNISHPTRLTRTFIAKFPVHTVISVHFVHLIHFKVLLVILYLVSILYVLVIAHRAFT